MEFARPFIPIADLSQVELVAQGLEFLIFEAISPTHGRVALRVPKVRVYHNVNDLDHEAKDLLQQELRIYTLLHGGPVPVPKPYMFLEADDGYPATLSEYVDSDGSEVSPGELGRVSALIHSIKLPEDWTPETPFVAQETGDALTTLVQRIVRRMHILVKEEPQVAPWIPSKDILEPIAEKLKRFPPCLLHMDYRDVNLRVKNGKIIAVFDWTNALFGPAAVDIYRILEHIKQGEAFLEGYASIMPLPELSQLEESFLRLDAALMLALVFISEAPDLERRKQMVERVEKLCQGLRV